MKKQNVNICMVNSPIRWPNEAIFLDSDIRVLKDLCDNLVVITGNFPNKYTGNVQIIQVEDRKGKEVSQSVLLRIARQLLIQFRLAANVAKLRRQVNIVMFNLGEYHNFVPLLIASCLGKKTVIFHHGGDKILESKIVNSAGFNRVIIPIETVLLRSSYAIVDKILCQSPNIVTFGHLEKYRGKILYWPGCYIDIERFSPGEPPEKRENIIGYSGRLSPVKGIVNLIKAIPLILQKHPDFRFIIAGMGPEKQLIEATVDSLQLRDYVYLTPWIPDNEFPDFLNKIKYFVLPSYEEGIPQVVREAMASGAIVLATPVGGLPNLIKDGESGFIMANNAPGTITNSIVEIAKCQNLLQITIKARIIIEKESAFKAVADKWSLIIATLSDQRR